MRAIDWDLIRGGHYGQRPRVPRSKAEHTAAPTNAADVKKVLANSEPSTHGGRADMAGLAAGLVPVENGPRAERWMFGRIFGLDGRESYRELRLEPLCCPHRLSPRNCSA